jgi:hypothetical protein
MARKTARTASAPQPGATARSYSDKNVSYVAPREVASRSATRKSRPPLVTIPDAFARVGASQRTIAGEKRRVPTIVLSGDWLKALGFPIDAPIYLIAEGHGRLAICRPGLRRPRWLRIVAAGIVC